MKHNRGNQVIIMRKITFREARRNAGLSRSSVANYANIDESTLVKFEKDSTDMPYDIALFLSRLYGIPLEYIHIGDEKLIHK